MVPTAELLAAHHRVYAPDLAGFGKSDKPPRVLNVAELFDFLAAWMGKIGLKSAALVGNSFGCQIMVELALRHPERVEKAVLQGPTVGPSGRTVLRQIGRLLLGGVREPPSLLPIELLDYLHAGFRRSGRTFRYMLEDRIEERLPQIHVPALVVRGSRDPIVPQRWAEEATKLLPVGQLVVLPEATHTADYGVPSGFARVVRAFLDSDRKPPGTRQNA